MLKKVVGYTALGYLAIIIVGLTLCCVFFNPRLGAAWGFGILFFAIPAIPLGLLFGMIISAVAQRAAKEKMESRESILSDQVRHQYNNDLIGEDDPAQIRLAYDSLKQQIPKPDDLHLITYTTFAHDSIIEDRKDTCYVVYFAYTREDDRDKILYARYRAWLQHVSRERFDMEIEGSKEYDWVQQQRQNMDDSVKKYQNAH